MKIVATADLHGDFARCKIPNEPCMVIIAGDTAKDGDGSDPVDDLNRQFSRWHIEYPDAKFILIAGNHDRFIQKHYGEMKLGDRARFLCDSKCDTSWTGGLEIYGTSWCPGRKEIFECAPGFQQMMFEKIPEGLDILVSHCPPQTDNFPNRGSDALLQRIKEMSCPPRVLICGHCHGKSVQPVIEDCVVSTSGKKCLIYCVATNCKVIEVAHEQ